MIKQITVAECDICGRIESAVWRYSQREDTGWYEEPEGWHRSPGNAEMILCPACWEKLNDKG